MGSQPCTGRGSGQGGRALSSAVGGHDPIGFKEAGHLAAEHAQRLISVDDVVGQLSFSVYGHLRSNTPQRFGAAEIISSLKSSDLCVTPRRDHRHPIHAPMGAGFDQHGGIVDDDRVGMLLDDGSNELGLLPGHSRVNDRSKPLELPIVREDESGERLSVDGSVRLEDLGPKPLDDIAPGRAVWFHHLSGQEVGIDDSGAAVLKHPSNRALAGCHPACQAHQDHAARIP